MKSVFHLAVISTDLHIVAAQGLEMRVNAIGYGVGHQVADAVTISIVDARQCVIAGIDDRVIPVHFLKEAHHARGERALAIHCGLTALPH